MARTIDSTASPVPLVPILLTMSIDAHRDVTDGIREFSGAFAQATKGRLRLSMCLRVAVEQLHRTYQALVGEAQRICTLSPGKLTGAIEALQRRNLVPRVHKGSGDFGVLDRACNLLQAHGATIPRRWTSREVHLFGLLVPLAAYTEELARELQSLVQSAKDPQRLEARLNHARREMEPVLRHFCLTAQALKSFMEQLAHPRR